jgi:hypothetical protein
MDSQIPKDVFPFLDALRFLWGARGDVFAGFVVFLVLATLFLLVVNPSYEASMVLAPPNVALSSSNSQAGFGSGSGGSGLTDLLGLKGAQEGPSPYDKFVLMLPGRELAVKLSDDPVIMHTIFASDWDKDRKVWTRGGGMSSAIRDFVGWMFGRGGWSPPGPDELSNYIQGAVLVKPSDQHDVTLLTYRNHDAKFARYFLEQLVLTADGVIRDGDRRRYENYQGYLSEQIAQASAVDLRQSLIALYASVTQHIMLVSGNMTYAVDILDGPRVTRRPVDPSITKTYLIFGLVGMVMGMLLAVARASGYVPTFRFLGLFAKYGK